MKRIFSLILLLLTICSMVSAQMVDPVKWNHKSQVNGQELTVTFTANIDPTFHLYAMDIPEGGPQKTEFTFETLEGLKVKGPTKVTNGKLIKTHDQAFDMDLSFYENTVTFQQRFNITGSPFKVEGFVFFMSCNDGMCTPPTRYEFTVTGEADLAAKDKDEKPVVTEETPAVPAADTPILAETDSATVADAVPVAVSTEGLWTPVIDKLETFSNGTTGDDSGRAHSWWYILIAGFIAGLVALITPCVWPMIPMTVSFFLKRTKDRSQSIRDAVTYGISIIVIYVGLGLLITVIFGASALNSLATNAVFNILFFLLLVVFAISFFGAFELTLPESWTTKLDEKADATTGLLSIFFMAFTLCLVSFSCTGPIIGTLLVEAATSGSMLYPAIGMFGFALALSLPFTLFAMFPSMLKSMPSSGGWLNMVKVVLGFCELALALKFLSVADLAYGWRILDRETFLCLWIVIFALCGAYLLGWIRLPHDDDPDPSDRVSVTRLMLALVCFSFSMYMVPGLWGAPCKAISAFAPPMSTQDFKLGEDAITTYHSYEEGMEAAQRAGKPVLVDFSGYGCVNCRKMEAAVWTNPQVKSIIDNDYILIELMVDDKAALPEVEIVQENGKDVKLRTIGDKWSYLQRYKFGANAQPFYVLLDGKGDPLNGSYSYDEDIDAYVNFLKTGLKNYKQ
ncbi:MAG: thioredoxin family protein [Bacteroidales bacterium]|nr:thioredoxin family protein [Bacteroidales bacterium]